MTEFGPPARLDSPLAMVCGAGSLPQVVAEAALQRGRAIVMFGVTGWADPGLVAQYPHHWIKFGQLGRFVRLAMADGCRDVVFIGSLIRPSFHQLRLDWETVRALPRLASIFRGGDNRLLSGLGQLLEGYGLRIVAAHDIAPEILVPAGTLGGHTPSARDRDDIACGLSLLAATGGYDIGQAVVVAANQVLAVEAVEGTDAMLARIASLRRDGRIRLPGRTGVLVKAPKPGQDRRFDLPAIGAQTVDAAAAADLAGIAVEAGGAITAGLTEMIRTADARGLFVIGCAPVAAETTA